MTSSPWDLDEADEQAGCLAESRWALLALVVMLAALVVLLYAG